MHKIKLVVDAFFRIDFNIRGVIEGVLQHPAIVLSLAALDIVLPNHFFRVQLFSGYKQFVFGDKLLINECVDQHGIAEVFTNFKNQKYLSEIYPDKKVEQVDIPVDPDRFRPLAKNKKLLAEFGLKADAPVAGIVARVQKHRNFSLLLDAIEQVAREIPDFKFLIVGRGTHIDTVARQPVSRRGLDKNVIFTGYRNDDYRDVLNLFDYKIFLVPGSDGSYQAVL